MPATDIDIPRSDKGWLDRLSDSLSRVLRSIGEVGTHLYHVLWPVVVKAWNAARSFVKAHPDITIAIVMLILGVLLAHPIAKGIIMRLGFGSSGIQAGSLAAQLQASLYGGYVPTGSIFSSLQSFGALL